MKEKELRLALVFYGGVSLAVYQHGVNIEILNLIRASKAYHASRSFAAKQTDAYTYTNVAADARDHSTEAVYFDLLKFVGNSLDLRIVVDVISGSSAGGINGIVLARAIAHDLNLLPVSDMWFAKADILQLIAPEARAGIWSKWYVRPFLRPLLARMTREGLLPRSRDAEIRQRISTFVRSRWFKPPFGGAYFSGLLLDGLAAMERPTSISSSLLPPGSRLDLLVAVTDFNGAQRTIFLHDPVAIQEREHRQFLRFQAERVAGGQLRSDFNFDNIPSLAFAARASASYPGAFPPARLKEMDEVLAARKSPWPGRQQFLDANFAHYRNTAARAESTVLLDGSILNNKPVFAAIAAIRTHRAYREVDRRLVYIDPHPSRREMPPGVKTPGFFTALRGALSDLPRYNPIYEELEATSQFNVQIGRLKAIIRATRPHVEALVDRATGGALLKEFTVEQIRHWRLTSSNELSRTAIVYNAWMRLLVLEAADFVSDLVSAKCGHHHSSQGARWVRQVIETWCETNGLFPENYQIPDTVATDSELPRFARFVVDFGVKYKRRRIAFVLQDINSLYSKILVPGFCRTSPDHLDALKSAVYERLNALAIYDGDFLSDDLADLIRQTFCHSPASTAGAARAFAADNKAALTQIMTRIGDECGLVRANDEMDKMFASPLVSAIGPNCRRIVISGYLGFPYWDVLLLPATNALGLEINTFEEVLVDRISPSDAKTIRMDGGNGQLHGASAIGFGGFLSRAVRENDYLWGRVHAIDRLIDIVASTIEVEALDVRPDFQAFKKRAFEAMLRQESARLSCIPDVIADIKAATARL